MKKKILIIEDEQLIYELLEKKLSKEGYDVKVAKTGVMGMELLPEFIPDIILLDIVMPNKNGFEVMEFMRDNDRIKDIPIIIISNSGQPVELDRAKELGASDWLIKTQFDPQEVLEKVKKYI